MTGLLLVIPVRFSKWPVVLALHPEMKHRRNLTIYTRTKAADENQPENPQSVATSLSPFVCVKLFAHDEKEAPSLCKFNKLI